MDIVTLARDIAAAAHEGQVDKLGEPYIEHPHRVVERLWHQRVRAGLNHNDIHLDVAAGWLHDAVEDTDMTFTRLRNLGETQLDSAFWLDWEQVITAVRHLTHAKSETNEEYWHKITECERAVRVKLADIADNTDPARLAGLSDGTIVYLVKKYARALRVLRN